MYVPAASSLRSVCILSPQNASKDSEQISIISINNINPTVLITKASGAYCEVRTQVLRQVTRNSCFKKCLLPNFSLPQIEQCTYIGRQTQRFITARRRNPATRLAVSIMSRVFSHSVLFLNISLYFATLTVHCYHPFCFLFYTVMAEMNDS